MNFMLSYWLRYRHRKMLNSTAGETQMLDTYGIPESCRWTVICMYTILFITALLGNAVLCYNIYNRRSLVTATNVFITSLSISDIMVMVLCIPITVASNILFYYWPFGEFLCSFIGYLQLTSVFQRSFTLVVMTCDMHRVVWRPMRKRLSIRKAKLSIALVFVLAALIGLPTAIKSKIIYLPYEPGNNGVCLEHWGNEKSRFDYSIAVMILQYFAPLLLMVLTYSHIGIILWVKRPPGEANTTRDTRLMKSKKKTLRMLFFMVAAFALSWLPFHIITLIGDTNPTIYNNRSVHVIWIFAHWLAFGNIGIYPYIYFWSNSSFRSSFRYVFRHCLCCACCKVTTNLNRQLTLTTRQYRASVSRRE